MTTVTAPIPGSVHHPGSAHVVLERPALGLLSDELRARRLEALLGGSFEIVARAQDLRGLRRSALIPMDVLVVSGDAGLVSREGVIEALSAAFPETAIVVLAKAGDGSLIRKALRAGASGYVCEAGAEYSLEPAIRAVLAGQLSVPRTVRSRIVWSALSLRERQVLQLVASGLTNAEIASRLYLSESTVKSHLSSSFRKLNVSSRAEAAAAVLDPESGLSTCPPAAPPFSLERELLATTAS